MMAFGKGMTDDDVKGLQFDFTEIFEVIFHSCSDVRDINSGFTSFSKQFSKINDVINEAVPG